jgi:hypothetical protein
MSPLHSQPSQISLFLWYPLLGIRYPRALPYSSVEAIGAGRPCLALMHENVPSETSSIAAMTDSLSPPAMSQQFKMDIVLGFAPARPVVADDVDKPVEQRCSGVLASPGESFADAHSVRRMASFEVARKPFCGCVPAQTLSGAVGMEPPQHEATFRSAEATAKDVVEGVEAVRPSVVVE